MRKERKVTFKRTDLYAATKIIDEQIVTSAGARVFREGCSDETLAAALTAKLAREITTGDAVRLRQQLIGKLATDGRASADTVAALVRSHEAMLRRLIAVEQRVHQLEHDLGAAEPVEEEPQYREAVVLPKNNGRHR